MPGSCTKKRKVLFDMNINEQTVSRNLNLSWLLLVTFNVVVIVVYVFDSLSEMG